MIRFMLICIVVVGFLVFSVPVLLIEKLIGLWNKRLMDESSLRMVQGVFRLVLWIAGVEATILGEGNVPQGQAVLYVANHRSFFDVLLTYSRCPGLTGYVAKKSMEKIPLLSAWMRRLHCLFLDRENVREGLKTILQGIEQVKSGISVCIFPEGTRNRGEELLLPFKEGSLKIAEKTGCPVIPIAITNTADIFENQFPKIRPCKVIVEYGAPILVQELSKEEKKRLGAYTQERIREMLEQHILTLEENGNHEKGDGTAAM